MLTEELTQALINLIKNVYAPKNGIKGLLELGAEITEEVMLTALTYGDPGEIIKIFSKTNEINGKVFKKAMESPYPQVIMFIIKKAKELKELQYNSEEEIFFESCVSGFTNYDLIESVPLATLRKGYRIANDNDENGDPSLVSLLFKEIQKRKQLFESKPVEDGGIVEDSSSFEEIHSRG